MPFIYFFHTNYHRLPQISAAQSRCDSHRVSATVWLERDAVRFCGHSYPPPCVELGCPPMVGHRQPPAARTCLRVSGYARVCRGGSNHNHYLCINYVVLLTSCYIGFLLPTAAAAARVAGVACRCPRLSGPASPYCLPPLTLALTPPTVGLPWLTASSTMSQSATGHHRTPAPLHTGIWTQPWLSE